MEAAVEPIGEQAETTRPGRIVILRHGRPALDREAGPRLNWREYRDWWSKYEAGSLHPEQKFPESLFTHAGGDNVVFFSSERRRAIETAQTIARGRAIVSLPVFNEAPLPPPEWSDARRYLPKTWNKIARVAWLFGHSGGDESVQESRRRAEDAAEVLVEAAESGRDVVLAAHGWFNRMLRRPLAKRGWKCVKDGGDSYWSCRIYEKR